MLLSDAFNIPMARISQTTNTPQTSPRTSNLFLNRIGTVLDLEDLNDIYNRIVIDEDLQRQLDSQGFYAPNSSCAYSHQSSYTVTIQLFEDHITWNRCLNEDRVFVAKSPDGRTIAGIFDGVGGDEWGSAYTAQAAADFAYLELSQNPLGFSDNCYFNQQKAKDFSKEVYRYQQSKLKGVDNGSTTAIFVDCVPVGNSYWLQAIALGDSTLIKFSMKEELMRNEKRTVQLTKNNFGRNDQSECPGCISLEEGVIGLRGALMINIEVQSNDIVFLFTDGVTDNFPRGMSLNEFFELVVFNRFFDLDFAQQFEIFKAVQKKEENSFPVLPNSEILNACVKGFTRDTVGSLTPEMAAKRLTAYVKLVTHEQQELEDGLYKNVINQRNNYRAQIKMFDEFNVDDNSTQEALAEYNRLNRAADKVYADYTNATNKRNEELDRNNGKAKLDDYTICAFSPNCQI